MKLNSSLGLTTAEKCVKLTSSDDLLVNERKKETLLTRKHETDFLKNFMQKKCQEEDENGNDVDSDDDDDDDDDEDEEDEDEEDDDEDEDEEEEEEEEKHSSKIVDLNLINSVHVCAAQVRK